MSFVRKDGTVSYQGTRFEVPFAFTGKTIRLVVDPHSGTVLGVENESGERVGSATALDSSLYKRYLARHLLIYRSTG
jgi:putative transposase